MGLTLLDAQSQSREAHATATPDGAVRVYSAGAVGSQYHVTMVAPNGANPSGAGQVLTGATGWKQIDIQVTGVFIDIQVTGVFTAASKHVLYSV